MIENASYILKEYLNYHNDNITKYGENTVVLMQVGGFYEIYAVVNETINVTSLIPNNGKWLSSYVPWEDSCFLNSNGYVLTYVIPLKCTIIIWSFETNNYIFYDIFIKIPQDLL